eukprot:2451645-Prymnesium_polylepis.3
MQEDRGIKQWRGNSLIKQREAQREEQACIHGHHANWPDASQSPRNNKDLRVLRRAIAAHRQVFSEVGAHLIFGIAVIIGERDAVPCAEDAGAHGRREAECEDQGCRQPVQEAYEYLYPRDELGVVI